MRRGQVMVAVIVALVVGASAPVAGQPSVPASLTADERRGAAAWTRAERPVMSLPAWLRADARDGDLAPGAVRAALEGVPGLVDRWAPRGGRLEPSQAAVVASDGVRIGIGAAAGTGDAPAANLTVVPTASPATEAALQASGGTIRALVVLNGPEAPVEHRFPVSVPEHWTVVPDAVGGYVLFDGPAWVDGVPPAGVIGAPWAYDADGAPVPVTQTLVGDEIVLRVDHAGAAYPVVADPSYSRLRCTSTSAFGTTDAYMNGTTCPTQAFFNRHGYFPVWGVHQGVSRAVEQRGECSWYPDTGPYWDFQIPCKGHDYCWDLVRMNKYVNRATYTNVTEGRCDQIFRDDLFRHCGQRGWATRGPCRAEANLVHAAVLPFSP